MRLRKRLSIIALTVAAVIATTLTTAQPAQAERNDDLCQPIRDYMWYASHMYTWYYTFYGPNHPETQAWAEHLVTLLEGRAETGC